MLLKLTLRMVRETRPRLLWKFLYNFGWKGMRAVNRFERRLRHGDVFPAFFIVSVTNNCNLNCQGCWVSPTRPPVDMPPETLENILRACKREGSYFFGLLGGEPLLYPPLFDVIARHPDCYFQVFTNGTLLTDAVARRMAELGNVTPLVSIEGLSKTSDERRGGAGVYAHATEGLAHCRAHRLITGVATSVCRSNFDELVSETFVRDLIARGAHYLWYYIYRPAGARPTPELALSSDQIATLRRFLVDNRPKWPIMLVDAYWDAEGRAVCPAAMGISHHITPAGWIEPCPPIQFAADNAGDGTRFAAIARHSEFLRKFRSRVAQTTRGCVLLERPDLLKQFAEETGATDSSGRGTEFRELAAMCPHADHHMPGREIPEKHWMYRFAKRKWFFGFGAYG